MTISNEIADLLDEAERNLAAMIFLAEAAEMHEVAFGNIERARNSLAEIRAILEARETAE